MDEMKSVNLGEVMNTIRGSGRPNTVLWQAPDSIAFVARGREFRSEFHSDPSDEVMYMIRGDMNLHYRTPEGDEKIVVVREGEIVHCPAGTPHSPRFSPDAFVLVLERKRRADESDRFTWFCEKCGAQLHQSVKQSPTIVRTRSRAPTKSSTTPRKTARAAAVATSHQGHPENPDVI